ncbi:CBS and ACT domain-containing protein [Loigolactobacillus zhaoyuanensis]|uniref:CBS and ACT domain-containing protein n=1 Tax=Loigolactobacillus zhaoyuanensis TaxID=2486017 RepID=A0ABW8UF19_9LACO|nr:CBS and ACT domain-containing protein [Loigolactobacillus zhaoyuanensis]
MSVADYMTKKLITVRPETRINDAVDLMKNNDIHRLPVLNNGQLVGLVTEGIIQAALPSKATSLSVYEVNYLLNKTTVADVMEKDVRTIPAEAVLEDAIYQMRHYKIGVLPVLADGQLVGIITNNDIFDAFLDIAGYDQGGTTVTIKVTQNVAGFLAKVSDALAEHDYNILTLMVTDRADVRLIELHVDTTDASGVKAALTGAGFELI